MQVAGPVHGAELRHQRIVLSRQLRGDEETRNPAFRAEHEYREEDFGE
jgi:hypothetical protein